MVISEKQVLQLMTIAEAYASKMPRVGKYCNSGIAQDLLATIKGQQSKGNRMNDFMKYELECLQDAIVVQLRHIPMSKINAIGRTEIVEKLQTLIDNYDDPQVTVICTKCRRPPAITG